MVKIGLTGGIGTGKTTVAKIFEKLGVPVYYADDRAKEIMRTNSEVIKQIKDLLGAEAYHNNGLNTRYISGMVFDNKNKLSKLEAIVHPAVRKDFLDWVARQKTGCVIVENAILHKSGMDQLVDIIILVTADIEKRLNRIEKRDGKSKKNLKKIIKAQKSEQKMLKNIDYIIKNNENVDDLFIKAIEILSIIKKKC